MSGMSTACPGVRQAKYVSSALLALCEQNHRWQDRWNHSSRQRCERPFHAITPPWSKLWCFNGKIDMLEFGDRHMMLTCMCCDEQNKSAKLHIIILWLIRCYLREKVKPPITRIQTGCRPPDQSHTAFVYVCYVMLVLMAGAQLVPGLLHS